MVGGRAVTYGATMIDCDCHVSWVQVLTLLQIIITCASYEFNGQEDVQLRSDCGVPPKIGVSTILRIFLSKTLDGVSLLLILSFESHICFYFVQNGVFALRQGVVCNTFQRSNWLSGQLGGCLPFQPPSSNGRRKSQGNGLSCSLCVSWGFTPFIHFTVSFIFIFKLSFLL